MALGERFQARPCYRIPRPQRRIVRHHGSLTRLLRSLCQSGFSVRVLSEATTVPHRDEALALGLDPRQRAWIREVLLCGDTQPWVRARTVIPLASLRGPSRALKQLGNRPLGSALFGNRPWRRVHFTCGLKRDEHSRQTLARRSLFRRGRHQLLVTESFLPLLWEQALARQSSYQTIRMDAIRPL